MIHASYIKGKKEESSVTIDFIDKKDGPRYFDGNASNNFYHSRNNTLNNESIQFDTVEYEYYDEELYCNMFDLIRQEVGDRSSIRDIEAFDEYFGSFLGRYEDKDWLALYNPKYNRPIMIDFGDITYISSYRKQIRGKNK